MKKQIKIIREMADIEKQLTQAQSGVLCIHLANEKLMQIACNFIYLDKNVYTYLDSTDENFEHIKYGSPGAFTVSSTEKINSKTKDFTYRLTCITLNGEIRDVDDNKLREQITELYRLKYSRSVEPNGYEVGENLKAIILDTKEIKPVIEEGN